MTESDALTAASNFDRLPEDAVVNAKTAVIILGGAVSERTLRRAPPITRRKISQRRYGFRVGDLRALIRGEIQPNAA
jgi:hypothetical protein